MSENDVKEVLLPACEEKILSYAENQGMDSTDIEIYRQELTGQINEEESKNELKSSVSEITKILDIAEKVIDFLIQNNNWYSYYR